MTATMTPRARANTALAAGVPGTRVGYRPTPARPVDYWPDKGTVLARQQIAARPQTIIRARLLAGEWLDTNLHTAPGFVVMANYWAALNAEIEPHGEMAWFLRYNH